MTITVIVPTKGRPTLARTLASISPQLDAGDSLIVIHDPDAEWGNRSRDRATLMATTSHLMFLDDDDVYLDDALTHARAAVETDPESVHIFRMRGDRDGNPWHITVVEQGQVGTPMVVIPRRPDLPHWEADMSELSDVAYIQKAVALIGAPVWHEQTIVEIRPA